MKMYWLSMRRWIGASLSLLLSLCLAYSVAAQIAPSPDPTAVQETLDELHAEYRDLRDGVPYTTEDLEPVDPDLFGIAIVTVGGDTYGVGDHEVEFAIQSISKAFV